MEYMEMLGKIIDADREAKRITLDAKTERDNLPDELRAEADELRRDYLARAERRVQIVRQEEEGRAEQEVARLDATLASDMQRLEAYFSAHRDELADKLFSLVIDT
ncbi:MAG: hypothetical protein FWE59_00370 [Oscillospiraceae bacterium]|nr:hypothetical protein [Oscillospiraceae bacterium]